MLDDQKGDIKLLEPKRPVEFGRVTDLKYCWYHSVFSHPLEKSITLNERIMQFARYGKIILDLDDIAKATHISTQWESSSSPY